MKAYVVLLMPPHDAGAEVYLKLQCGKAGSGRYVSDKFAATPYSSRLYAVAAMDAVQAVTGRPHTIEKITQLEEMSG